MVAKLTVLVCRRLAFAPGDRRRFGTVLVTNRAGNAWSRTVVVPEGLTVVRLALPAGNRRRADPNLSVVFGRINPLTSALAHGEPVRDVAERLGHSKTSLTLDVYAHATVKKAPTVMRAVLFG